ncbi:MAG: helix-turn-helix domain-containing protein [Pseudomonadota bacterium]
MNEHADTRYYGDDIATFGDRVAAARDAISMSQAQLARRLGVKVGTIEAWEADRSEPRANRLQMLAGVLNVSIMWLMTGEGIGLDDEEPLDDPNSDAILRETLAELRALRTEQTRLLERLGRLEKKLRMRSS